MNQRTALACWILMFANSAGLTTGFRMVEGSEAVGAEQAVSPLTQNSVSLKIKRVKQLEARLQKLEVALKTASKEAPSETIVPRFQMLPVGKNVVILDMQTGDTRIVEPPSESLQQSVEIGKSWVTVTILVNAADRNRKRDLPSKAK